MIENAHVRAERARLQAEWDAGEAEGFSANVNVLPEFYFRSYSSLHARQRAYIFGRELQLQEIARKRNELQRS